MSNELCEVCQTAAQFKCSRCLSVSYCGKIHQKENWSKHQRTNCVAYKVKTETNGNRYLIAARDIKEGEVILTEIPLALSTKSSSCPGCIRRIPLAGKAFVQCPRCKWPVCSKKCPGLTDPAFHGAECEILSAIKSSFIVPSTRALLPLRCLLLQKTDPKKWKIFQRIARQAESFGPINSDKESRIFLEEAIFKPLAKLAPHLLPADRSPKTLRQIFSVRLHCVLLNNRPTGLHTAVCEFGSLLDHSCLPNTRLIFEPPVEFEQKLTACRVVVQAANNIPRGHELTTSFVSLSSSTFTRQTQLMFLRNDQCFCKRCLDPREFGTDLGTLKCEKCPGWILPVDTLDIHLCDWKCTGICGKTLTTHQAFDLIDSISKEFSQMESRGTISIQSLERMKTRLDKILHPNHFLFLMLKSCIVAYYRKSEGALDRATNLMLQDAADVCRELISASLNPCFIEESNFRIAEALLALSEVNLEILKRRLAWKLTSSAKARVVRKYCSELKLLGTRFANSENTADDIITLRGGDIRLSPF